MAREINSSSDYKDILLKLIPSEIIGAYIVIDSISQNRLWLTTIAAAGLLALTPFYLRVIYSLESALQISFISASFVVWTYSLGGPFKPWGIYDPAVASVILILWTLLIPLVMKRSLNAKPIPIPPRANANEKLIIEVTDSSAIRGVEGYFHGKDDKRLSVDGKGSLTFVSGTVDIHRTNTEGRFELWFNKLLPAGKKRIKVSCEAKVIGGKHTLRFVVKDPTTGKWLANESRIVTLTHWTPIAVSLQTDSAEDSQLRIDDEQVEAFPLSPLSIQIRKLLVTEQIS